MASVVALCISEKRGTTKYPVDSVEVKQNWGILGDAHAGDWHRQISLLASESMKSMQKVFPALSAGSFAENILTEGIRLSELPIGTEISGGRCLLKITQIGKECHQDCAIRKKVGDCIMPREGVFAIVLKEGIIQMGDEIHIEMRPDQG